MAGGCSQRRAGNRSKRNGLLSPSQATIEEQEDEARKDSWSSLLSCRVTCKTNDERLREPAHTHQAHQRAHLDRMASSPSSSSSPSTCTWRCSRSSHRWQNLPRKRATHAVTPPQPALTPPASPAPTTPTSPTRVSPWVQNLFWKKVRTRKCGR